ncbi:MAG: hypothetical protein ABGF52_06540 [Candidatus Asgardarchaeum sp.]
MSRKRLVSLVILLMITTFSYIVTLLPHDSVIFSNESSVSISATNISAPLSQFSSNRYPSAYLQTPRVTITPEENGSVPVSMLESIFSDGVKYHIISRAKINIYDKYIEYLELPPKTRSDNIENIRIATTGIIIVEPIVPAYWTRGSTITIKVKFKSYLPFTYTFSVTIACSVWDKYLSAPPPYGYFYSKREAYAQKTTTITLRPYGVKYVYVYVPIG